MSRETDEESSDESDDVGTEVGEPEVEGYAASGVGNDSLGGAFTIGSTVDVPAPEGFFDEADALFGKRSGKGRGSAPKP